MPKRTAPKTVKTKPAKASSTAPKLTGKARALSRVTNPTARAAISKSPGRTLPAGNLMAQAKANINSMLKQGGTANTTVRANMPARPVKAQRKPKR